MAMQVQTRLIGVDVAKAELVMAQSWTQECVAIANERAAIVAYLKGLSGPVALAVEATNCFHVVLVEEAYRRGHAVYLVDGFRLSRYRDGVGVRAKTDSSDARLLLRYLTHEREALRPWSPPPRGYATVQNLLRRRAALVQAQTTLRQSLQGLPGLKAATTALFRAMKQLDLKIQLRLQQQFTRLGWQADAARCAAIEGIGPLTSMALAMLFRRGAFASADAYIAFMGLDVRVRDSGRSSGRRKLTKKGDPEMRRLLYMAAMTACRSTAWKGYYEHSLARGLTRIQALVALARKLARVAFALLKNQSTYEAKIRAGV